MKIDSRKIIGKDNLPTSLSIEFFNKQTLPFSSLKRKEKKKTNGINRLEIGKIEKMPRSMPFSFLISPLISTG